MAPTDPPLSLEAVPFVLQCLRAALATTGEGQKQAEAHLQSLEDRAGFCSCLAEVMVTKEADHSARWLAATQLKNAVGKFWRSRPDASGRAIGAEEKAHLRTRLPLLAVQEDNQIAVQVALTWAKVARQDYPNEWPGLFSDLLGMLSAPGASQLTVRRTLLVVHHTIKELATKRLATDQRHFTQVSLQLFQPMWTQWCADTAALLAGLPAAVPQDGAGGAAAGAGAGAAGAGGGHQAMLLTLERWLLLLKVLRRLLVFGRVSDYKSLQPVQEINVCAPAMLQALQQLGALRPPHASRGSEGGGPRPPTSPFRNQLLAMLDRGLLKLIKVVVALQESHPWSFHASGALVPTLAFCCDQLVAHRGHGGGVTAASSTWDRYLIQCMSFIMNVVKCPAYRGKSAGGSDLTDHEQDLPQKALVAEVAGVLNGWWTPERLTGLAHALITGYGQLSARDLDEWVSSSEEWYHAGDVSGWQEHLSLAADALYLVLLGQHRALLGPLVVRLLHEASAACPLQALATQPDAIPGGSMPMGHGAGAARVPVALLAYDAVLSAVALGAYDLHDYLDYTPWLRTSLLPVLATQGPVLRVLRRQALRVVAAWVARLEEADRPQVYAAVLACMGEPDATMQLTAVTTLHALVDDWNFSEGAFEPCVATSMQLLLNVLGSCTELGSQSLAFNVMNLIIERMGDLIKPWVQPLAALLPGLWQAAEGQGLLRIQVLLALQRLVNVLGLESPALYQLLLPLLSYATDPSQPEALHLLEDGLGLYLVTLRNAPALHPELLAPLPHVAAALSQSTEHIAVCMAALTSAALLARDQLATHAHHVSSAFELLLGNVNERGMLLLLPSLEMVAACAPGCLQLLRPATSKLLALLLGDQETAQVKAYGCCVVARLLLLAPQELPALISLLAAARNGGGTGAGAVAGSAGGAAGGVEAELLSKLLDVWGDSADALAQPRQRKLSALGLCALLAHVPSPPVLAALDVSLGIVTGVWAELEGGGTTEGGSLDQEASTWAMWAAVDSGCEALLSTAAASEDAEGESRRRAELRATDPVPHARLRDVLRGALEAARSTVGPALDATLAALDPTLVQQVQQVLSSTAQAPPL